MTDKTTQESLQRQRLAGDPHRPRYHFLPPANWMNDPNGLIQWQGQYHLFYQYNPHGPFHERIHWGHASSNDLVHWTDLPIALTPTVGRADEHGCWSGCAVNNNGTPTLLYSAVHPQVVCLASGDDDLLTWHYYPQNPVIAGPPAELAARTGGHFRDPFAWREGDTWYLLMGSTIEGIGGAVLLYRSHDLTTWEYIHPLLTADSDIFASISTGAIWECPNWLSFGEQRGILFSAQDAAGKLMYPVYALGTFHDEQFFPRSQGMLVHGGYFYAPQVLRDEQGRYIMWGWLMEGRSAPVSQTADWAGVMSLPIIVAPLSDGGLSLEPASELALLREQHWHDERLELSEGMGFSCEDIRDDCLEILAECEVGQDSEFGFRLRYSPDGREQAHIVYQSASRSLFIERKQLSLDADVEREYCPIVTDTGTGDNVTFHIFLDRSVLEVFVNGCYLASRIYPEHHDSVRLELFARRGGVNVSSLDVWHMASIWKLEDL